MTYLDGFRLFFRDPNWRSKAISGGLLLVSGMCIPLIGQLVIRGWMAQTMRLAALRPGVEVLPARLEWDSPYLTRLLGVGFRIVIGQMIWAAPIILLGIAIMMGGILAGGIAGQVDGGAPGGGAALVMMILSMIAYSLLLFLGNVLSASASIRVALTDRIESAFEWREILDFTRRVLGPIFIGLILIGLAGTVAMLGGMLLCCVGIFPAMVVTFFAQACFHHLLYVKFLERGGKPIQIVPPIEGAYPNAGIVDANVFS